MGCKIFFISTDYPDIYASVNEEFLCKISAQFAKSKGSHFYAQIALFSDVQVRTHLHPYLSQWDMNSVWGYNETRGIRRSKMTTCFGAFNFGHRQVKCAQGGFDGFYLFSY